MTRNVWPYALASGVCCSVGLGVALLSHSLPAVYGAAAASMGALCALSAMAAAPSRLNGVLAAFVIGFLCRMLLLGVGLVASGARAHGALTFAFFFFVLYLPTQVVEVVFVSAHAHGAPK